MKKYFILFGIIYSCINVFIILRGIIFSNFLIKYGDLYFPFSKDIYPVFLTWDQFQQTGVIINHRIFYFLNGLFDGVIAQKIYLTLLIFLLSFISYLSFREILMYCYGNEQQFEVFISSILGSLLYIYNPIVVIRLQHYFLLLYYAFLPLLFITSYKLFSSIRNNTEYKYGVLKLSFLLFIMSASVRMPYYFLVILFTCMGNFYLPLKKYVKNTFVILSKIMLLYCGFCGIWLIPYILNIFYNNNNGPSNYIITKSVLSLLSRNANLYNVLTLSSYWATTFFNEVYNLDSYRILWTFSALLIPILSITALFFLKHRIIYLISCLLVLVIFLGKGVNEPISVFYEWLVFSSPFSFFGWQFRGANKWNILIIFSYSILFVFTSYNVFNKLRSINNKRSYLYKFFIIVLMLIPTFSGYPLFSGTISYNQDVLSKGYPDEGFLELFDTSQSENLEYRVLCYPTTPFYGPPGRSGNDGQYFDYLSYLVNNNDILNVSKFLSPLNIKYVYVNGQSGIFDNYSLIKNNDYYTIPSTLPQIYVSNNMVSLPNLESLRSIFDIDKIIFNSSVLFSTYDSTDNINNTDVIVLESNEKTVFIDNDYLISPFDYTDEGVPWEAWSLCSTSDPLHGAWHPYLDQKGLENWDFDYGEGLVFTWATNKVVVPKSLSNDYLMQKYDFETQDLGNWSISVKELQALTLSYDSFEGTYSLNAALNSSEGNWNIVSSPLIPVKYGDIFRWIFNVKAENVYNAHAKISEYAENGTLISNNHITRIGTESFNWQETSFNFAPTDMKSSYLQLQIWYGHDAAQPFPSLLWLDDIRVYDLERFIDLVAMEIPYNVPEAGEYVLLARIFKNQQGGSIQVQTEEKNYVITTRDQLDRFAWIDIDTQTLQKGRHTLTLTNVEGFNAVNLFALVPTSEFEDKQNRLSEVFQDKRIIYIFEAESDLYHENAETSSTYHGEASSGQTLHLKPNSKAWSTMDIQKNGNYILAIRAKGNFTININDYKYTANSTQFDWIYLGPINLDTGTHEIVFSTQLIDELTHNEENYKLSTDLDVIWLYSTDKDDETLEDVFLIDEDPAELTSFTKINPTKYKITITSKKPFMLSFAEAYDSLWVARVDGEKVNSVPLYSVINGFWIDKTGIFDIIIEYEPQRWFYLGSIISISTVMACLIYLAYYSRAQQ